MVTCRGKSKDKRLKKSNAYRCNELTVLAPLSRVISYVRSQRSCENNSKDFAAIIIEHEKGITTKQIAFTLMSTRTRKKKLTYKLIKLTRELERK